MYSFTSASLVQAHLVWRCLFGIGCYTVHLLSLLGVFESCMDDLIRGFTPRTCCCATPLLRQHAAPPTRCTASAPLREPGVRSMLFREHVTPPACCSASTVPPEHSATRNAVPRERCSASAPLRNVGRASTLLRKICYSASALLRELAAPQACCPATTPPRQHATPRPRDSAN